MKNLYLLLWVAFTVAAASQTPSHSWLWGKGLPGNNYDEGLDVAVDPSGNIYIAGYFVSNNFAVGNTTLTNQGLQDIFIAKYNPNGNILWAKSFGGPSSDYGFAVACDRSGNVFLTGSFISAQVIFGSDTLLSNGGCPVFVVKINPSGNILWAQNSVSSDPYSCFPNGISTDPGGNVIVSGVFAPSSMSFGVHTVTQSATGCMFLVKYDTSGNPQWAFAPVSQTSCFARGTSCDTSGNIFVTGVVDGPLSLFGTISLNASSKCFVAKFSPAGIPLFAVSPGGNGSSQGWDVGCDRTGNVYLAAMTSSTETYGTFATTAVQGDPILAKMSSTGSFTWIRKGSGNSTEIGFDVAVDSALNVTLIGAFSNSIPKPLTFGTTTLNPPQTGDPIFIIRFDEDGNTLCSDLLASGGDDRVALAVNERGDAFVCADYTGVDPFIVGEDTLHLKNIGNESIYLAKWRCEVPGTGISERNIETVLLFPNPVKNNLEIRVDNDYLFSKSTISIKTMQGKTAANFPFAHSLDCSGLIPGAYILEFISSTGKIYRGRFIKE
jgi:hypothetical protein